MKKGFRNGLTAALVLILITLIFSSASFAEGTGGNLVAHYKFDGDFTDSSGNGNDGTLVGDVTFADDGVIGKNAVFNGGFLNVPSKPELNLGSNFTISVWVKVDPVMFENRTENGTIISKLDDNGYYNNYNIYTRGKFGASLHGIFTGGERSIQQGASEDFGMDVDWSHLVFSCDGQSLYLYHNGNLKASKPLTVGDSLKGSENIMRIGTGNFISNTQLTFKGRMDDLRIYDYSLSVAEIKALYDASGSYKHKIVLQLNKPTMIVDNVVKEIDPGKGTSPISIEGRTMVPIRAIVEEMGGTLGWDGNEQRIDIKLKSKNLQLWVNRTTATLDGKQLTLDVPPKVIKKRTMVPLRFVGESLGCKVQWDGKTQKITIQY